MEQVRDGILAALVPVVEGLAATFGASCEVVLHDYRRPDASVVAVGGSLTGRRAGGAMSEIGLSVLAQGDEAVNDLNYVTRTRTGMIIKSSTLPLKDPAGHLFGALCVNIDVTALRTAQDLLADLAGLAPRELPTTTFSDDLEDVVDAVVRAAERAIGKPARDLTRAERLHVVLGLEEQGAFLVRGSASRIATALGVSRASLYADLAEVRRHISEST
ncbi:transcriptional regulator [Actinoplanes sp. NPDC051494]|uniref:transcriptional regulator n=1 Tax=Actinoplanes sp. NPDC051494 TaxID=3363907 RepID=UPI0037996D44